MAALHAAAARMSTTAAQLTSGFLPRCDPPCPPTKQTSTAPTSPTPWWTRRSRWCARPPARPPAEHWPAWGNTWQACWLAGVGPGPSPCAHAAARAPHSGTASPTSVPVTAPAPHAGPLQVRRRHQPGDRRLHAPEPGLRQQPPLQGQQPQQPGGCVGCTAVIEPCGWGSCFERRALCCAGQELAQGVRTQGLARRREVPPFNARSPLINRPPLLRPPLTRLQAPR